MLQKGVLLTCLILALLLAVTRYNSAVCKHLDGSDAENLQVAQTRVWIPRCVLLYFPSKTALFGSKHSVATQSSVYIYILKLSCVWCYKECINAVGTYSQLTSITVSISDSEQMVTGTMIVIVYMNSLYCIFLKLGTHRPKTVGLSVNGPHLARVYTS